VRSSITKQLFVFLRVIMKNLFVISPRITQEVRNVFSHFVGLRIHHFRISDRRILKNLKTSSGLRLQGADMKFYQNRSLGSEVKTARHTHARTHARDND